ncbi:MAG: DUF3429 domain-containing protein [Alphaproteobacteria bacterium]
MTDDNKQQKMPSAAQGFGYVGLVPLVAGAIAVWTSETAEVFPVAEAMLFYSATVLSFLGGVRWGMALNNPRSSRMASSLTIGIFPPLVAWVMLLIDLHWGLLGTAVAFALMYASDLFAAKEGTAPAWYPQLRMPLTIAADVAILIIFARVMMLM